MKWIWKFAGWPNFTFDEALLESFESEFIYQSGVLAGTFQHINYGDQKMLIASLARDEALNTSKLEGESLIEYDQCLTMDVLENCNHPLTHQTLFRWHSLLMKGRRVVVDSGAYRAPPKPMGAFSGLTYSIRPHYVAPPSKVIKKEMQAFVHWFNNSSPHGKNPLKPLLRAGICHVYFLAIYPFHDGNGRIGRALVQKVLSQSFDQMAMIALASVINGNKKAYYAAMEDVNLSLDISKWLLYFSKIIVKAQSVTLKMVRLIVEKEKLFARASGKINKRQEIVLNDMFREGPLDFKGGLSAENYISMTSTSRATATRDLKDLVTKGILKKTGQLKKTRYHLLLI